MIEKSGSKRWLNGWRRLWLASTGLAAIIALVLGFKHGTGEFPLQYYMAIKNEFANPACNVTANAPFKSLTEPEFTSDGKTGCWYIYSHRQFQSDPNRPLTFELYNHDRYVESWQNIASVIALYLTMVLVGSGIVYAVGKTVAWIRAGFRQA